MNVQVLVAAMNRNPQELIQKMRLEADAIIINQCDRMDYEELNLEGNQGNFLVKFYSFAERGVGLSRNNALLRAEADIVLFSDDDIVYEAGYSEKVRTEFEKHPEADMILFEFDVIEDRRTYHNEKFKRIHFYNCGRYPTFSFAIRREKLHRQNITYSLLFGGGAKYSNGEDSLFIRECIQKGMKVFASPVKLGREEGSPSTWFDGYHEKFFYDRGVLYHFLYGKFAILLAFRFLLRHREKMCTLIPMPQALSLMKKGIRDMQK